MRELKRAIESALNERTGLSTDKATMQANARAHQANRQARLAELLRAQGHMLPQIAAELNQAGYRTRRGGVFHPTTVWRLLPKEEALPPNE